MPPDPSSDRDRQTLQLLVAADPIGLQQLLVDHGGVVRLFLHRKFAGLLQDWQIEEALSLAAIRVWQSAPRIEPAKGSLRSWFAVIARNRALLLITPRPGERTVTLDDIDPALLGMATSSYDEHRLRLVHDVDRCISRLEPLQQAVLLADLNAGTTLPTGGLAERFDTSPTNVETARQRGRHELRKMLEILGHHADEGDGKRRDSANMEPESSKPGKTP